MRVLLRKFRQLLDDSLARLGSVMCRAEDFETDWYRRWARTFGKDAPDLAVFGSASGPLRDAMRFDPTGKPLYRHRKVWEWCAIAQALDERGMLRPGTRGCGFAVGREPLASLFAGLGINVLATDLAADATPEGWKNSGQHAATIAALHWPNLVSNDQLVSLVRFEPVDMRNLSSLAKGDYDFVWSSCALEHLGNLELGLRFIEESAALLRKGGVAVHTTEFNLTSDTRTLDAGDNVLYRRSDLLSLRTRLQRRSIQLAPLNFDSGSHTFDTSPDVAPWYTTGRQHVKLVLGGFVTTSMLLICTRQ